MVLTYSEAVVELPLPQLEYEQWEEEQKKFAKIKECRLMVVDISEDTYFKFPI